MRGSDINCCHDWRHAALRTFGIATVPILPAVNPAPGANIGIEIEIMATGTAIEAHTTAPTARTALRQQHYARNEDSSPTWHIEGNFETHWRRNLDVRSPLSYAKRASSRCRRMVMASVMLTDEVGRALGCEVGGATGAQHRSG